MAQHNLTRAEAGYVGDHLTKLATVDSNTLRFTDFHNDGQDNILKSADGNYIMSQNYYDLGSYYVTAVDSSSRLYCGYTHITLNRKWNDYRSN